MGALPTGVVSFVLTDIVDSTGIWERAPDAMDVALARHDELVASAITAAGGTVLKARGEGDSTFSVFTRATDAVRAARDVQAAVLAEPWPTDAVIRTRAAVHTGEAVERDGDYLGPAVNRVARLRGVADGGEVIVSASTAAIVRAALPEGCTLVDIGTLELRGVGHEPAFLLAGPGLGPVGRRGPPPAAPPVAPTLPPMLELLADPAGFVGRVAERAALRRRWEMALDGHTLLVVVSAEAGMGKSRLVAELAAEVHAGGGQVLLGACYEDVDLPYGPFVQALDDAHEIRADGTAAEDLLTRDGVIDGIRRQLMAAASSVATLLVIEDLHWSTSTTRDVVRHLARRAGRERLLVVVTTRDAAPDLDADLASLLGDLERLPSVTRIELPGLSPDEVAELSGATHGAAAAIAAASGGNPLLITYVTADGHPASLPALLARREELLDDEARVVLDVAAAIGAEFDARLLARARGVPLLTVLDALDTAESAGLVIALPGRPGGFAFVHALFRSHRYDNVSLRRRLELHAAIAAALEGASDDHELSERARHACLAVPAGDARTAVDLARAAAAQAERAFAYDEAIAHYERAYVAAGSLEPPEPATTRDLRVRLAAALVSLGDPHGVPKILEVAEEARRAGDDDALVLAASSFSHFGATTAFVASDPAPLVVIDAALDVLSTEPSARRARLLIEKAGQIGGVRIADSIALAQEAEAIARHLGDDSVLAHVLLGARFVGRHPSRLAEEERIGCELQRLGTTLPSLLLRIAGTFARANVRFGLGELGPWADHMEQAIDLLGDRNAPFFQLDALAYRANRALLLGDLDAAERLAFDMAPLAAAVRHPPETWVGPIVLANRRLQARDSELIAQLDAVLSDRSDGLAVIVQCCLAATLARGGQLGRALAILGELRATGYPIPEHLTWTWGMAELAEAAEVTGDRATAHHVLDRAGPFAGQLANSGAVVSRPIDQVLAQAALAAGHDAAAVDHAGRAVARSRERGTPPFLARELVFLAEARRRCDATAGDVRRLVREALTIAETMGAAVVAADVERYGLPT